MVIAIPSGSVRRRRLHVLRISGARGRGEGRWAWTVAGRALGRVPYPGRDSSGDGAAGPVLKIGRDSYPALNAGRRDRMNWRQEGSGRRARYEVETQGRRRTGEGWAGWPGRRPDGLANRRREAAARNRSPCRPPGGPPRNVNSHGAPPTARHIGPRSGAGLRDRSGFATGSRARVSTSCAGLGPAMIGCAPAPARRSGGSRDAGPGEGQVSAPRCASIAVRMSATENGLATKWSTVSTAAWSR